MFHPFVSYFTAYIAFIKSEAYWGLALTVFLVSAVPILWHLLDTGHAKPGPKAAGSHPNRITCWDSRFWKAFGLLGGSNALTFGLVWYQLALWMHPGWIQNIFFATAKQGFVLAIASEVLLIIGLFTYGSREFFVYWLNPHWRGCGYDTATSPFWWLFWLQKAIEWYTPEDSGWKYVRMFIVFLRDVITTTLWIVSIPLVLVSNVLTVFTAGKAVLPGQPIMPDE